jgi:hypothetical protein
MGDITRIAWLLMTTDNLGRYFKDGLLGRKAGFNDLEDFILRHPFTRLDGLPPGDDIETVLGLALVLAPGVRAPLDGTDLLVRKDDLATGADEAEAVFLVRVDLQVADLFDPPGFARTPQGFIPGVYLALQVGISLLDAEEGASQGRPCPVQVFGTLEKKR